jgi:hypothetical protein
MDTKIKLEFVRRVLQEQADELDERQTKRINRYLKFRTGRLLNMRNIQVQAGGNKFDGKMSLDIPIYGRFQDMRKNKAASTNRRKLKNKNTTPIYNVPTMQVYNVLGKKLMFFLTKETIAQIKQELSNQTL